MSENVTVEVYQGKAWVHAISKTALYAGDTGTTVTTDIAFTKPELRAHIANLIQAYRAL